MTRDAEVDRNLLAAVTRGDRAAVAELYNRHASQMLALACRILSNRRDAEDLLHDVFLEAWQKAQSYDADRGTVRTWLLMRMRSRAIDRIRVLTTARDHSMVQISPEPGVAQTSEDPSQAPDRTRARQALASLSEEQRGVIALSYFEGLTCQEIAARCEIPVGTVKSRLSAAVTKLRREFTQVGRPG